VTKFKFIRLMFFVVIMSLFMMSDSYAQTSDKLGDVITRLYTSFGDFPKILTVISYMSGLLMAITGIFKFKDHVDNPQNPLSAGVKRFLAGGMMLSLPYMARIVEGSLMGSGGEDAVIGTTKHTLTTASAGALDGMVYSFIGDIYEPVVALLRVFTYLSAIIFLIVGISRLIKTSQDGPKGPTGMGTIATFLVSGALFSAGGMMGAFTTSLFGNATVSTYANISSTVISDATDANRIAAVVESVMAFIMLVGYIAFIRGWFVIKEFADGGNASLAQALTFLFGGVLAINLGDLINVIQASLGLTQANMAISFG